MALATGRTVGPWVVDGRLGQGGIADVWAVHDARSGVPAALKVLRIPSPDIRARLLLEARALAAIDHPNVVRAIGVLDVDGSPGLVMERIVGPSLRELLARMRPDVAQATALGAGILAGVAAAHDHGLAHRDLKPANVLLAVEGGGLIPKIVDFGLAKILAGDGPGDDRTVTGTPIGTPAYMAPEQIRDARAADARSDVFALGAVLYELLAGRRAFDGADVLALYGAVAAGIVAPLDAAVPAHLRDAVSRALAVDPSARPADASALLALWGAAPAGPAGPGTWPEAALASAMPEPVAVREPEDDGLRAPWDAWEPVPAQVAAVAAPEVPAPPRPAPTLAVGSTLLAAIGAALLAWGAVRTAILSPAGPRPSDPLVLVSAPSLSPRFTPLSPLPPPPPEPVPEPLSEPPRPAPVHAPPPIPVPAAPVGSGTIYVNTRPTWSNVAIDDRPEGRTNWHGAVAGGPHVLALEAADGRRARLSFTLADGEELHLCWNFDLDAECPAR
jgi:hypothetical protein